MRITVGAVFFLAMVPRGLTAAEVQTTGHRTTIVEDTTPAGEAQHVSNRSLDCMCDNRRAVLFIIPEDSSSALPLRSMYTILAVSMYVGGLVQWFFFASIPDCSSIKYCYPVKTVVRRAGSTGRVRRNCSPVVRNR